MGKRGALVALLLCCLAGSLWAQTPVFTWRYRTHATDCTALTDGKPTDLCWEEDDSRLYKCNLSSGTCDEPGDWVAATVSGSTATLIDILNNGNLDNTATSAATGLIVGGDTSRCRTYEDATLGATIECFAVVGGTVLTFDEVIYNSDPKRWILHNGGNRDVCWAMDDTGLVTFTTATESCGTFAGTATFNGVVVHAGGSKHTPTFGTADTYTMLESDCGTTIANADADALEVDLIANPTGCVVCFFAETAQTITLDPNSTDTVIVNGLTPSAGDAIQLAGAVGNNVCLQGKDSSTWWAFPGTGTLTDVN